MRSRSAWAAPLGSGDFFAEFAGFVGARVTGSAMVTYLALLFCHKKEAGPNETCRRVQRTVQGRREQSTGRSVVERDFAPGSSLENSLPNHCCEYDLLAPPLGGADLRTLERPNEINS